MSDHRLGHEATYGECGDNGNGIIWVVFGVP